MTPSDASVENPGRDDQREAQLAAPEGDQQNSTSQISSPSNGSVADGGPPRPAVPDTLRDLGRYRILHRLGHGGMGSVYLAEDSQLQRKVALKVPKIPDDDSGEWLERFYREARAAATIHHSHLCPVYDVGEIDGVHFLTMAYIEGEPLSATIANRGEPWAVSDAAALLRKVALAIHVAHEKGIVHRDLKPANIMLDRRGEPVIVDFGLARRADADDGTLTRLGELLGTPAYMSPEQVEGIVENIGPPSDLYSLGVILFELLTGRRPFQGSAASVLAQILRDSPPPPSNFRAGLDSRIEAICCRLLSRQPADRYPSGLVLSEALDRYLRSEQSGEVLPTPLKERAKTITPPRGDSKGYGIATPPVAATSEPTPTAPVDSRSDLGERIETFLVNSQLAEALLACQSHGESFTRSVAGANLIRRAFTNAINQKLQARRLKQAVRIAGTMHSSALPVESADILAKTLSAVGRMLWNDSDPGPALQLWRKQIEKFPETRLLAEKAAIFAYNRGVELEMAGKSGLAIAHYRIALDFDPHNAMVRKRLATSCLHAATTYAREGRLQHALTLCEESLQKLPGNEPLERLRDQVQRRISQQQ